MINEPTLHHPFAARHPENIRDKTLKANAQPIVAISERKQNLFWICRTEQQSAKLNFAKEPFSPSRSNPKTADAQVTKNSTSIEVKCLIMNKSSRFRGISPLNLSQNRT